MKKTRLKIISITMAAVFLFSSTAWALPQGATVVNGNSTITKPDAQTMHITQTSDKSIINWQGYSIGTSEKVQYFQPGRSSISLNRVTGQDPSGIYGHLSANGQVWVINPNGLLIGNNAKINTGSFLGSTLNIGDDDFLKSNYKFKQQGALTSIKNFGSIISQNGGYVALISPEVVNEGSITANLGKAYLASGSEFTLNFAGNDLIGFTIDKEAAEAALGITNKGLITANGGEVRLSAKVASDMMKTVVNNEGVIEAKTIAEKDGRIFLLGDMGHNTVEVSGTLDASASGGGNGGFIETSAAKVKVADSAVITTYAPYGKTGTWLIDPTEYTIAASGGNETGAALATRLGSNNIIIDTSGSGSGNGDINVNDAVTWSASTILTLNAYRNVNVNANITATGDTAGLVLTPNYNGGSGGAYSLNNGASITLSGLNPSLSIAGQAYTVINSLGAEGSMTGKDLQGINGGLGGYYALGSNIDASVTSTWNSGAGFDPVGINVITPFIGAFDGLGHTVNGLMINRPTEGYVGLFGYIGSDSVVRNVGIVGGNVHGTLYVGGLVGLNTGSIVNSYNTGATTGTNSYIGGLVGFNAGSIVNSYNTGDVNGLSVVGGLVGDNTGSIVNSYNTGYVTGSSYIGGGLVGYNSGSIVNSYNTGSVNGSSYIGGGLVGYNYGGHISNSYNTGSVTGSDYIGGLVGSNTGSIVNSYNTGDVNGLSAVGGLVGSNGDYMTFTTVSIVNSYNTGDVNGLSAVGGLVGRNLFIYAVNPPPIDNSYNTGAVTGTQDVGGLVGWGKNENITNSHNSGAVIGTSSVGGLVGHNEGGITNSYNTGAVTGNDSVGGLVGYNWYSNIYTSYNTGAVTGTGDYVGGLVGYNWYSNIYTSYNTGAVTGRDNVGGLIGLSGCDIKQSYNSGNVTGRNFVGGLIGLSYDNVSDTYSTGSVTGTDFVGGLVGYNFAAISTSYSAGAVAGATNVGGLVGHNTGGSIANSFWDTQTSGQATSAGGVGKTTAELMQQATYSGWDFTNTWWMSEGNTRPFLRMEYGTTITNAHQLQLMALNLGASYTLANNIDMSELTRASGMWNTGTGFVPVGNYSTLENYSTWFTGFFDGLGHTVNGLMINRPAEDYVGLFGLTVSGSTIRNVGLVGVSVTGYNDVGGLVGHNEGTISTSYNTGSVNGHDTVGGLVGHNKYDGAISNSYSAGLVTGSYTIGGLVGNNDSGGAISNSYSSGLVSSTGSNVGGLLGANIYGSTVANSFWDTQTSGYSTSAGGTGKTTAEMKQLSTFTAAGWDIDAVGGTGKIWRIYEGSSYPLLRSFLTTQSVTAKNESKTYDGNAYTGGNGYIVSGADGNHLFIGGSAWGAKNAGTYNVTLYSDQQGYDIIGNSGAALTITPKALTLVGSNATNKVYDGNTTATVTAGSLSGLVGTETLGVSVSGDFADRNAGTGKTVAASYTLFNGTGQAGNYTLGGENLTAAITPKALTVTANNDSKLCGGHAYSGGNGVTYNGFINGETASVLGGAVKYGGTSQGAFVTGAYTITPGGLASGNYAINYANGALAITPAPNVLNVYDLLKNKTGVMTETGDPVAGLLTQKTLNYEIAPSVFSNE